MANSWNFTGRLGADAESRTTNSGEKVLSFRVATDTGFGERRHTDWVDCSLWGKRGEAVAARLTKGTLVWCCGELKLEAFKRRDGSEDKKLAVRIENFDILSKTEGAEAGGSGGGYQGGSGGGQRSSGGSSSGGSSSGGGRAGGKPAFDEDLDDTIPF